MINKKESEKRKSKEGFGISGFTLILAGFLSLLFQPLFLSPIFFIIGLIFCIIQQRNQKTKLGKIGIILGVIGIIVNVIWIIVLIKVIMPWLQENLVKQLPSV